jgi:MSHA pilin protein MshD
MSTRRQDGVTLIELIVAMVIVAVAVGGMLAAFNRASAASVDPVVTKQMAAVAEALMEEIQLKPYDNGHTVNTSRATFDEVTDYNGYRTTGGIVDLSGNPIAGLEKYNVLVSVSGTTLTNIANSNDAVVIAVTVSHEGDSFTLNGWRTRP